MPAMPNSKYVSSQKPVGAKLASSPSIVFEAAHDALSQGVVATLNVDFARGFLLFEWFFVCCPGGKRRRRDEVCDKCHENSDGDIGQVHIIIPLYTTLYI